MEDTTPKNQAIKPGIDFGLYYAGDMAGYLKFDIPFDYYPHDDYGSMREYIDTKVFCFINEIHHKYRRMGYFTAPFLARCALRAHDGRILFVSPPQLMGAGLLPPCLDHFSFPEYDRIGMHFTLKGCPCFKLMIRLGELPPDWAAKIKCVDIYVSRQIKVTRYGGGHRCRYSDVLRSIKSDQSVHDRFDAGEFILMKKDRYCKNGFSPVFAPHYNDAKLSMTPVWYVKPNNDLIDMLAAEKDFYNIASIEACDIVGHKSFHTISIRSTLDILYDYLGTLDEALQTGGNTPGDADITPDAESRQDSTHPKTQSPFVFGCPPAGYLPAKPPVTHMSGFFPFRGLGGSLLSSGLSPPLKIPRPSLHHLRHLPPLKIPRPRLHHLRHLPPLKIPHPRLHHLRHLPCSGALRR